MKNDIKNQSPEERMITTLRFAKNTLYNSGICGKFFQIAYYCEDLITANQDTLEVSKLDALIDLHDFAERAKRNKMAAVDMIELIETIGTALKSNPVEIAA